MIIRLVMIGDNRFPRPIRRNYQPLRAGARGQNRYRFLWMNCRQYCPQNYPQLVRLSPPGFSTGL